MATSTERRLDCVSHDYMSHIARKPVLGFWTRSDTNWAVQPQKMA